MGIARVTLYNGIDNIFDLVVKKNKIALPLELTATDTFKVHLIDLATKATVTTLTETDTADGNVAITDLINGKITILIKPELVATLKSLRGSQADNYYVRPTYKLLVEADTANQGKFITTLDRVGVN